MRILCKSQMSDIKIDQHKTYVTDKLIKFTIKTNKTNMVEERSKTDSYERMKKFTALVLSNLGLPPCDDIDEA